jgi:ribosomal protein S18 acetylase RimI-like enzyme
MTALMSAAWAGPRRPMVPCTAGDLEWWTAGGGPDADWSSRIRLWELDGRLVGWGWINPPAALDWFVADGLGPAEERAVRGGILDWLASVGRAARDRAAAAGGASGEATGDLPPIELEAWAADGWPEQEVLAERGWTATDTVLTQYLQPLDTDLDPPRVPEGFTLRPLRGASDVPARVEVHRAAFAPSQMSEAKYGILLAQEHYAFEHDLVVEAPDGSFAAFAMCWVDRAGSIGEFEPVGVHPDHQRRGLGRVVMRAGLRLMREAGLRDAMVFSLRSNQASEALYRSAGFAEQALHRQYTKSLEP